MRSTSSSFSGLKQTPIMADERKERHLQKLHQQNLGSNVVVKKINKDNIFTQQLLIICVK